MMDDGGSDEARAVVEISRAEDRAPVGRDLLLRLHHLTRGGPGGKAEDVAGEFRTGPAAASYATPGADQVPELTAELFGWLDRELPPAGGDSDLGSAVIRALVTHAYLLWIHPFTDGNAQTARLMEACVLLDAGYPAVAARIPTRFYQATRPEYVRQLELATRDRSLTSFISYATQGFRDGLRELFDSMRRAQFESAWRGFVLDCFEGHPHRKRKVFRRRRELMLALPLEGTFEIEEIARLDHRIARLYSELSERTLRRDFDFLAQTGLLTVTRGRFALNTDALRLR